MDAIPPKEDESLRDRYVDQRTHGKRSRTVSVTQMRRELRLLRHIGALERADDVSVLRPRTRMECENALRPCPFVSCKFHLYLDIARNGSMKLNFPEQEPWEMQETCALDVTERGGATLEEVAVVMNLTRERVRQIEARALTKVLAAAREDTERKRRRLPLIDAETLATLDEFSASTTATDLV